MLQAAALALALVAASPTVPAPEPVAPPGEPEQPSTLLVGGVSLGIAAAGLTTGAIAWWIDYDLQPFSLKETGFFGRDTYAGGADKVGHLYTNYLALRGMAAIYRGLGVPHRRAVLYSTGFTMLVAEGVEVIDGFTKHGFEYGDVVMNLVGTGLAVLSEIHPEVDRVFGMRVGYVPSPEFIDGPKSYMTLVNDYSGQVVYADLKLGGVLQTFGVEPGPARFFLLGANYGSYLYAPRGPAEERRRNLGVHLGLSLPEVLHALELGRTGDVLAGFFTYYAMPFVTVNLVRDLNHDRFVWNFGVGNRFELGD